MSRMRVSAITIPITKITITISEVEDFPKIKLKSMAASRAIGLRCFRLYRILRKEAVAKQMKNGRN